MFCKWCGADIPNSATKCSRCGKDVPTMSDCGGFYDLVPSAKRSNTATPSIQSAPTKGEVPRPANVHNDAQKRVDPPKSKKTSGRKARGVSLVITCLGFILVLAFVFSLQGQLKDCLVALEQNNKNIGALSTDLLEIRELVETEPSESPTKPTDAIIPEIPAIEDQNVVINIDVAHDENGTSVKTTADLGDFDDTVTDQVTFDKDTHSLTGVTIDLSEAEGCIEATIKNVVESGYSYRYGTFSVAFEVNDSIFETATGEPKFEWAYRTGSYARWEDLDEDVFTCDAFDGEATVSYSVSDMEGVLGDYTDAVEFQVKYTRENIKGGSLTVVITGITISKDSLKIEPDLYY